MTQNYKIELLEKLAQKKAKITIVGAGYVGLPLSMLCSEAGFYTIVLDTDKPRLERLKNGESDIEAVSNDRLQKAIVTNLNFSSEYYVIGDCDIIIICLPTPLNKSYQPDLSYIENAMSSILPFMRNGQMIVLESTSYPGTTEELIVNEIIKMNYLLGEDYFVAYSPEREDPGNEKFTTFDIPKIVSGHTENCLSIAMATYGNLVSKVVTVSSTKAAELTKLFENIYRAVNIGLVNETKIIADKLDINIHEVIDAAGTKPFGFNKFYAGPGIGGHCIPIDPFYLSWKAKEIGVSSKFIDAAGEINREMPNWIVHKIILSLNSKKKSINGSKILIFGMAYKKDVGDWRESPAIEILLQLTNMGAQVEYCDPLVNRIEELQRKVSVIQVDYKTTSLASYDAIVIATDHSSFNYAEIQKHSNLIIDTRNVFKSNYSNVVKA